MDRCAIIQGGIISGVLIAAVYAVHAFTETGPITPTESMVTVVLVNVCILSARIGTLIHAAEAGRNDD
jgi:hypothetical protein